MFQDILYFTINVLIFKGPYRQIYLTVKQFFSIFLHEGGKYGSQQHRAGQNDNDRRQ